MAKKTRNEQNGSQVDTSKVVTVAAVVPKVIAVFSGIDFLADCNRKGYRYGYVVKHVDSAGVLCCRFYGQTTFTNECAQHDGLAQQTPQVVGSSRDHIPAIEKAIKASGATTCYGGFIDVQNRGSRNGGRSHISAKSARTISAVLAMLVLSGCRLDDVLAHIDVYSTGFAVWF